MKIPKTIPVLLAFAAMLTELTHASYFGLTRDTADAQECITYDARYPYWTDSIYIATYPGHSRSKEGWIAPYYGGVVSNTRGKPNLIQYASWQMGGKDAPASGIDFVHAGRHMSWVRSTWEGSSGGIKGLWPTSEFKPNKWYRFFHRVWTAPPNPHLGFAGVWMKDLETGQWHHLATFKFPAELTGFNSMGGFCEYITGNATRTCAVEFRNIYSMRNGKWGAENTFTAFNHKEDIIKLTQPDPGSVLLETSRTDKDPQTGRHKVIPVVTQKVELKQPSDIRFLDPVRIASSTAEVSDGRCVVRWKVDSKDSPQLGYRIELSGGDGTVSSSTIGSDPETRECILEIPESCKSPKIRLAITDIFGRESKTAVPVVSVAKALTAVKLPKDAKLGLAYRYFESATPGEWQTLPDIAKLQPKRSGVVSGPDITPRLRRTDYAFEFTGFLDVPKTGLYQFSAIAASGVRVLVDERPVVNAPDYHSIARSPGSIALEKGPHRLKIQYFQGARQYQQADDFLQLSWSGPGIEEQPVPVSTLSHQPDVPDEPQIVVKPVQRGDSGILFNLSAEVTPGTTVERVEYYANNPHFDYYSAQGARSADYLLATATDPAAATPAVVWGGGGSLRARLVYANGRTADSKPVPLPDSAGRTADSTYGPYRLSELEHHLYPMACAADEDSITLVGDSMGLLTKPLTGDGSVTARLAEITTSQPQPDGTRLMDEQNWYAGIIIRDNLKATPGEPLGGDKVPYAAVLGAANGQTRYCDSTMINGAGNQPGGAGGGTPWLRIERKGNTFTLFRSADGENWMSIKSVDLPKMSATAQAGFVIYSIPCATNRVHWAKFDHIAITP